MTAESTGNAELDAMIEFSDTIGAEIRQITARLRYLQGVRMSIGAKIWAVRREIEGKEPIPESIGKIKDLPGLIDGIREA